MAYIGGSSRIEPSGLPFISDVRRPYSASHAATFDGRQPAHVRFHPSTTMPPQGRLVPSKSDGLIGGFSEPVMYPASSVQLEDQLRMYRQEIAKKNHLINQLTNIEGQRSNGMGSMPLDRSYTNEYLVQHDKLDAIQRQVNLRDEKIQELKQQIDMARDLEARQSAEIQQLRRQIAEYDMAGRGYGGATTLRPDNKEAYDRIRDLEARLRNCLDERERTEQERIAVERRMADIISQFRRVVYISDDGIELTTVGSLELLLRQTTEIVQENTMLRAKLATLQGHLESAETEQKTNRETIYRMMNDQQNMSELGLQTDNLRVERDAAVGRQKELLAEIDSLKDQLDASRHAWSTMRRELDEQKQQHRADVDRENLAQATEMQSRAFKDCLAKMLSDGAVVVEPYEEVIRERVQNLVMSVHEKNKQLDSYDAKISKMAAQLDAQYELNRVADRKLKRAEADLVEMEDRLRRAECSLPAGDVARLSHERCVRLLERVSRALNMPAFPVDVTVDEMTNEVIVRAEQLCQSEIQNDRKTLVIHLQRKVKKLKEKLVDKERQVDAIQRRLSGLEDRMLSTSDSESERDEIHAKNRKLVTLIEKYKCEHNEAHLEIRELKSRLMASAEAQMKVELKNQDIANLGAKVDQLENIRHQQASELENLSKTTKHIEQSREEAAANAAAMAEELNRIKFALNDVTRRQKELLELRTVIGRMLGLNAGPATAVDFEIVARLEKLILANRANMASTIPVDADFEELARNFRQGNFGDTGAGFNVTSSKDAGAASPKVDRKSRSRSQSPAKKPDKKVY